MKSLRKARGRYRALFKKDELDREMSEEMRSHIEMQAQEHIEAGMSPEEARRTALLQFGSAESIKETCREERGVSWVEDLLRDLRYGGRMLAKYPGFTTLAVLVLGLGIGATTAMVSIAQTAVLDPLPTRHPGRVVQLGFINREQAWRPGINPAALRDLRPQTNLFAQIVAYGWDRLMLPSEDFPQPVPGLWVTPEFFRLWGLSPQLGRTFAADEGQPGKDDVLVISHRFWQRQFGGDPAVVGRTVVFRERPMTVIGIMPRQFAFPEAREDYWRPMPGPAAGTDEYLPNTQVIAEMLPTVKASQVQAFLDVITRRQGQQFMAGQPSWFPFAVRDLRDMFSTPEVRRSLGLLLGAVLFVLIIAATNVANLQLARTETRQQELAMRAALGAGRGRVFRQLVTESLLLAVLAGVVSLALTALSFRLLQGLIPAALPRVKPIALNWAVLGIASAVSLSTGLLFGLAPACRGWRANLSEVLKLGAVTNTRSRGRGWFSRSLIVGQLAMVVILLSGAGLMTRSVINLLRVNPNLDPRNVVRVYPSIIGLLQRNFNSDPALNKSAEAAFVFFADARERVAAVPGVVATGVGFEGREMEATTSQGSVPIHVQKFWIGVEKDDPLRVLRIPLRQGRFLDRRDLGAGVHTALVNETAARQLWPGESPVGKRFIAKEQEKTGLVYEVVGVVGDTRDYSRHIEPEATFYRTLAKEPNIDSAPMFLVVRTAVKPEKLYKPIGMALKAAGIDPEEPFFMNLEDTLRTAMAGHRTLMLYLLIFSGIGLLLGGIGLYGVLSYSVARRTREIGVRMAMGAQVNDVKRLVVGQGLALVGLGAVIGLLVALSVDRVLRAYLFGVASDDAVTLAGTALLLSAVALLACWVPARRAAKVDPMVALRGE